MARSARLAPACALLALALLLPSCKSDTGPGDKTPPDTTPTPAARVAATIDPGQDRREISPYIYGSNQDYSGVTWTVRRYGGNRLTGYNWTNNFSNAGSDYLHQSDDYLLWVAGLPGSVGPAGAMTHFHDQSLAMGAASILTLQMAGYVARDGSGPVTEAQAAPSPRWARVQFAKGAPFTTTPGTADSVVYMDELVSFLVGKYGNAASARGVRWYSLDNEPALWPNTHARIHPQKLSARELIDRSVALASAVKAVDPQAGILGPAAYGFMEYYSAQDAPDWSTVRGSYRWYIDYYLAEMKKAEQTAGRRLLDVLDVHWYPEARGTVRITEDAVTPADEDARMQAPRTFWDSTYTENSWIAQSFRGFLPILPSLSSSIQQYYPGTKLAITEYNFGAGNSISGGIAQADVLGIFGRSGVYVATLWGIRTGTVNDIYAASAFRLYRDYDGQHGTYGSTAVRATTEDVAESSIYAAIEGQDASRLHVILLNKTRAPLQFHVTIAGTTAYLTAEAWGFDATGAAIKSWKGVSSITGNAFDYTRPALSAAHLVLHR